MGCGGSKVDDLPLVTLCRERKEFIKVASEHRYALAAAHVSYFRSLKDVGDALRKFVDEELVIGLGSPLDSPVLTLPSDEGKGKKYKSKNTDNTSNNKSSSSSTSISHSGSALHSPEEKEEVEEGEGSHLHLSSGSDSELDSSSGHLHIHEDIPEPEVPYYPPYTSYTAPWIPPGENPPNTSYTAPWIPPGENPPNTSYTAPWVPPGENPPYTSYTAPWNPPGANPPYTSNTAPWGGNSYGTYYMKRSPTRPTVVYQDHRGSSANVQWQDPSNSYSSYSQYGNGGFFGGSMGSPPRYPDYNQKKSPPTPPPAPPPPEGSSWDFLNIFNAYNEVDHGYFSVNRYGYGSTASSPDSKEVREREGIPDLEDETEPELLKEARKEKKLQENVNRKSGEGTSQAMLPQFGEGTSRAVPLQHSEGTSRSVPASHNEASSNSIPSQYSEWTQSSQGKEVKNSPDTSVSKSSEEYPRKKAVSFELDGASTKDNESSKLSSLTTLSTHGTRDLAEVVKEIRDEFETASSHGKEVSVLLEVGKLPYQSKGTALKVIFSKVMYSVAPSKSSSHPPPGHALRLASSTRKMAKDFYGDPGKDLNIKPSNLSSTLEKLYIWEKKLYKEVKDEERLRVVYEKKCKRLRTLDHRGAESNKIEATQASTKKLLAKLNVNIRTIDAISSRIHKLRDEELQPQLSELIHGLIRMWKSVLKCHQRQFQAIIESKIRTLRANTGIRRDSSLRATLELEMELLNWCSRFNNWINTQKSYIASLNGWLLRCLLHEPEETPDGIIPFSPGRIGAPQVFVICNDWFQAMDRISESAVAEAMHDFAISLHQLWERQDEEQRQRIKAESLVKGVKGFEEQLKTFRMERGKIEHNSDTLSEKTAGSKAPSESGVSPLDDLKVDLDTMRKRLEDERARHKEAVKLVHSAASSSIQSGLVPIFEALGNFTSEVLKAHEQVRINNTGTT